MNFDDQTWWRHAVTYQIYPRSFADADGDGTGDVAGIIEKLPHLAALGVDALWVSPWYPSPMADGGYDVADYCDISAEFGTLEQADAMIRRAHELGIRVLIDLVPNHSSDQHPWFQQALAAAPGSPERARFHFLDGRGDDGEHAPTNWGSLFGGSAWQRVTQADGTPGQWYLHMFAPEQPDWNWTNPEVIEMFDDVLRFWFDRGVDGIRVDVADAMAKDMTWPDTEVDPATGLGNFDKTDGAPMWLRPELAEIHRRWRRIADSYAETDLGPRIFVAEAVVPIHHMGPILAPDRLHTSFCFDFLKCEWRADSLRHVIDEAITTHATIDAPTVWVLENHDVVRSVSRYGKPVTGVRFADGGDTRPGHWQDELADLEVDVQLGRRRARAAATLMLALPGGAYVYQGQELGLDEVDDLPEDRLQDPVWERSGHVVRGRDGCRVPLPWSGTRRPFGFGTDPDAPWLPQRDSWAGLTAQAQADDEASTLSLYRRLLRLRRELDLRETPLVWNTSPHDVLDFTRQGLRCIVNLSDRAIALPDGAVLASSGPLVQGMLPVDTAVWLGV